MGAIPQDIRTDTQPPLTVPLRHFVVALGLLVAAGALWALTEAGAAPPMGTVAYTHLLLAGWVCLTIMGAMTQFVPVWAGVTLHSDRLASVQLWLVVAGLLGFVGLLLFGPLGSLVVPGALMVAGFWTFVYNVGRTIASAGRPDVTTGHFAVALGWFVVLTALGVSLAATYARPGLLVAAPVTRTNLLLAHATAAVFGAVFTTVIGALYQLSTMFTQTELSPGDRLAQQAESASYPVGVAALVVGRLLGHPLLARIGAALVLGSLAAVALVVGHRLLEARVDRTPMLTRYAVVVLATLAWVGWTAPAWLADPIDYATLFGPAGAEALLLAGVLTFVVLGTLYHIVPFIVWFHRYSDLLGLEEVPMIDDLYDSRLAVLDFALVSVGAALLVLPAAGVLPSTAALAGAALATAGFVVFGANVVVVLRGHSPYSMPQILLTERLGERAGEK